MNGQYELPSGNQQQAFTIEETPGYSRPKWASTVNTAPVPSKDWNVNGSYMQKAKWRRYGFLKVIGLELLGVAGN